MEREILFKLMGETSQDVKPFIFNAFKELSNAEISLEEHLKFLFLERISDKQLLLRPFLVRLGFELSGSRNWREIINFCALAEILNISTYYSDKVFDNEVLSKNDRNNFFIFSILSNNYVLSYLNSLVQKDKKKKVLEGYCRVNENIYKGQFIDINLLCLDKINKFSNEEYLNIYTKRCEYLGGSLTSFCLTTGYLLGTIEVKHEYLGILSNIGRLFGTAGQILNDMSDFILLENSILKGFTYKESFSDAKNGRLTYPIYHLMLNLKDDIEKSRLLSILKGRINKLDKEFIMRKMCECGSFRSTKKIILSYYNKLKKEVKKLPPSNARDILSISFSSLITNKYFGTLRGYGY